MGPVSHVLLLNSVHGDGLAGMRVLRVMPAAVAWLNWDLGHRTNSQFGPHSCSSCRNVDGKASPLLPQMDGAQTAADSGLAETLEVKCARASLSTGSPSREVASLYPRPSVTQMSIKCPPRGESEEVAGGQQLREVKAPSQAHLVPLSP